MKETMEMQRKLERVTVLVCTICRIRLLHAPTNMPKLLLGGIVVTRLNTTAVEVGSRWSECAEWCMPSVMVHAQCDGECVQSLDHGEGMGRRQEGALSALRRSKTYSAWGKCLRHWTQTK